MSRKLFVNVAVEDLDRSVEFFTKLGFEFDPRFTDETATCMLVGEDAYFMLLTRAKFADFSKKPYADPATSSQAQYAITADSRDAVDALVEKALAAGGDRVGDPQDYGFMYSRGFGDPDGHHFEVFWMDPKAVEQGPAAVGEASAASAA
jgi:predicted lactoylglutathione lyase